MTDEEGRGEKERVLLCFCYGNRLVTASQNGEIKIWNFNNGHCLLSLDKGLHCIFY